MTHTPTNRRDCRRYYTRDPVVVVGIMSIISIIGMTSLALGEHQAPALDMYVTLIPALILTSLMFWRSVRWGVYVGDEGVRIVNFFSSSELIPWGDIRRFSLGREAAVGIAAALERTDGEIIWCSSIQHRWLGSLEAAERKPAGRTVAALNEELERRRGLDSAEGHSALS